jgi:hypothetical protein
MKNSNRDLQYVGSFSTLQTEGSSKLINYATHCSPIQQDLYNRLLKGINTYDKNIVYAMNSTKKKRIQSAHKKAQNLLNIWKQELTILKSNSLFAELFPNSNITSGMLKDTETLPNFRNTLTFKDLGITKEDIINKFLSAGLLPSNFATL